MTTKRIRLVSLIGAVAERREAHTAGHPLEPEKMLPVADVLLLIADSDPGAMLFRYTAFGEVGGDTWHESVEDAKEQARFEYRDALLEWEEVPDEITDPHAFAVQYAADRLKGR